MPVGLATAGETAVVSAITGVALSATGCFISLHTADPTNAGTSEVSGSSYGRQSMTPSSAGNNPTVCSNGNLITYSAATGSAYTVSYFGVWSAVTAGNFMGYGALTTTKTVNVGDTARFAIGALTITVN